MDRKWPKNYLNNDSGRKGLSDAGQRRTHHRIHVLSAASSPTMTGDLSKRAREAMELLNSKQAALREEVLQLQATVTTLAEAHDEASKELGEGEVL